MKMLVSNIRAFAREEDGVALTEYLILLGLLVGGVIVAVGVAGQNLNTAWESWGTFFTQLTCTNQVGSSGTSCS